MVIIIREENVPNLSPLNLRRRTTCPLPTQQLGRRRPINAILSIVVSDIAHQLLWQALMVTKFFATRKVAGASIAHES